MKNKFNSESLKPFIDFTDLKGTELVERKQFIGDIVVSECEEKTCVARITTIDEDAENDVIIPEGADLRRFNKNPIIHVNHSYKVEDVVANVTELAMDDKGIVAKMKFADTERANDCWKLVKDKFVRANSIGFIARKSLHAGTKEFKDYVKSKALKVSDSCRRLITEWELLESSIVSLPCNPEALMQAVSAKQIELSEKTLKELDLPNMVTEKVIEKIIEADKKEEIKTETTITKTEETVVGDVKEIKTDTITVIKTEAIPEEVEEIKEVKEEIPKELYFNIIRNGPYKIDEKLIAEKKSGKVV